MPNLIVQGELQDQQAHRPLLANEGIVLGRDPQAWGVPWEAWLSRRHAELRWDGERLHVRRLPEAGNPIFFQGEPAETFSLKRGDRFVIGRTTFTLSSNDTPASPPEHKPILHSYTVTAEELRRVPFRDAPHRLDVLGHLTNLIFSVTDERELFAQTINLLLEGIRKADAIALVSLDEEEKPGELRVLRADRRLLASGDFRPSKRLVHEAIVRRKNSVVHVWSGQETPAAEQFTLMGNFDWAFCTPLRGESSKGMGIYVAGRLLTGEPGALLAPWNSNDLTEDVKFTELVADVFSALRQTQALQHRQSVLCHFFSPSVLRILSTTDPETALRPREGQVTVLFCDLRGFSRKVEMAADNLETILGRVSSALGVMSTCILKQKGVVADFLGDSAMGFWGWPIAQPDDIQQACLAALGIRTAFEAFSQQADHPLADFKVGIGIATGRAVAGQIGSQDQAKVTVFGPVVNLASRLEGLTKILRVPILIDETTACTVKEKIPADVARYRQLAHIRPYGLDKPLTVSELLLPASKDAVLSDQCLADYAAALKAFLLGRWTDAYEQLHRVPPQDLGKDFLTSFILQHNHTPPPGWDGVIPIQSK
jgi:adenylate cyclase